MPPLDPAARFRKLALALPGVAPDTQHMGCEDFRAGTPKPRIFATLAFVARGVANLKLTPEQQTHFVSEMPDVFEPVPGGWGRSGYTMMRLDAPLAVMRGALQTAYNNVTQPAAKPRARA